jgi:hypothetical protein
MIVSRITRLALLALAGFGAFGCVRPTASGGGDVTR